MVFIEQKEKLNQNYETEKTKKDELDIIKRMCKVFNWSSYTKLTTSGIIDYAVNKESLKIYAVVEAKNRNILINTYKTIYLSKNKIDCGLHYCNIFKCKFFFSVKTINNEIHYIEITDSMLKENNILYSNETVSCSVTGTQTEIVANIPTNLFTKLIENN